MKEATRRILPALGLCALLVLAGSGIALSELSGELTTTEPLRLDGSIEARTAVGAVHVRSDDVGAVPATLHAEKVKVEYTWRNGTRAQVMPGGEGIARHKVSGGYEVRNFTDVAIEVTREDDPPELLAITNGRDTGAIDANGTQLTQVTTVAEETITRVEEPEEKQWVGDAPRRHGFWYEIQGPWVSVTELTTATVQGDFLVFVHNVTLQIETPNGTTTHWTGYEEEHPDRPVSDFESRVTVLHVTNGSLDLSAPQAVELYTGEANSQFTGEVRGKNVQGALSGDDAAYRFDGGRLEASGSGSLDLRASPRDASMPGTPEAERSAELEAAISGSYDIEPTTGVTRVPVDDASDGSIGWLPLLGAGLFLLLAGIVVTSREKIKSTVDAARAEVRDRRVSEWMRTGDRLTRVRDYERALTWYTKVADRYPNYAEAWYSRGACLGELGRHAAASEAYERANELVGGDDPEIIDRIAAHAWRAGDDERAIEWFRRLAHEDPRRLRERLSDGEFAELLEREELLEVLDSGQEDGAAGYV